MISEIGGQDKGPKEPSDGAALATAILPSAELLAAIESDTKKQIAQEGRLSWLRARPTSTRRAILLACLAVIALLAFVGGGNLMVVLTFLVIAAASMWLALKPICEAPAPGWLVWSLPVAALITALAVALRNPDGAMPLSNHIQCFLPGLGIGFVFLGVTRLLSRGPLSFVPFAAAVGAGLAANAFLAGRCQFEPTSSHVLIGHGSVLVVLLAVSAATALLEPSGFTAPRTPTTRD